MPESFPSINSPLDEDISTTQLNNMKSEKLNQTLISEDDFGLLLSRLRGSVSKDVDLEL
jgi:hypothetical protein